MIIVSEHLRLEKARELALLLAKADSVLDPNKTYYIDPDMSLCNLDKLYNCSFVLWNKFTVDLEHSEFISTNQLLTFFMVSTRQRNINLYVYCRDYKLDLDKRLIRNCDIIITPLVKKEDGDYIYFDVDDKRHGIITKGKAVTKVYK